MGLKIMTCFLRLFLETLEHGPYDRFVSSALFEPSAALCGPGDNIPSIFFWGKKKASFPLLNSTSPSFFTEVKPKASVILPGSLSN